MKIDIENGVIYRITSPNGKKRIGYTLQSFAKRMGQYKGLASSKNKRKHPLTDAIRRYGWEAFKKEIIIDNIKNFDLLCELEKHYIRLEATTFRNLGYNFECGGVTGARSFPIEVLNKMREGQKKRHLDKVNDIIGIKYGKLTAIRFVKMNRAAMYLWKCDCGNEKEILLNSVKMGETTSCGCARKHCKILAHKDISGQRFNRFLLEKFIGFKEGRAMYLCICDCGKGVEVKVDRVKSNRVKSCGCLKVERRGEKHHNSKVILNKETGVFYFSVKDAAFSASLVTSTLFGYLNSHRINKSAFIYV